MYLEIKKRPENFSLKNAIFECFISYHAKSFNFNKKMCYEAEIWSTSPCSVKLKDFKSGTV